VEIARPDKLMWPEAGVTKQVYADHLRAVAPHMLPWVRRRPMTLVRAPDGVDGQRYFQKDTPAHAPDWIHTVTIPAPSAKRDVRYLVCDDERTLMWLANQAALELHIAPSRVDRLERPDFLTFDIDPPDGAFDGAVEAALLVLDVLDGHGLPFGVKTTGGKGLHIVVPVERRVSHDELRVAASRIAETTLARRPDLLTVAFKKAERGGRVMIDPSRNGPGATIVAPYSARIGSDARVSFPVDPAGLRSVDPSGFTVSTAGGLLEGAGPRAWDELADTHARIPSDLYR
jgi:bifunctional non-homologous end joining protein LigD